jgi:phage tail sheath protein FI
MAELTFKSPGVSTREIDLSGRSRVGPVGTPAGVIGTSIKGRAFVPLVFANLSEFVAEFGGVGPDKFGPMALREWLSNARAGLYLKVLGVGDGKARLQAAGTNSKGKTIPAGSVKNAGFIVGEEQVNPNTGTVGSNIYTGAERGAIQATAAIGVAVGDATNHTITANDTITITDGLGVSKTYKVVAAAVGNTGDLDGGLIKVGMSTDPTAVTAHSFLVQLKAAIESENGHNGSIVISGLPGAAANSAQAMTLTQRDGGRAGNTQIVNGAAGAALPPAVTVNGGVITTAATVNAFRNGEDGHGGEGRTHFLSVLMKEVATSSATAKISYTGQPSDADTITLVSTDGTSKTYEFDTDTTITAGNVSVTISGDDADATYAALKTAIEGASGHNGKLSVAHTDNNDAVGDFTITQDQPGRSGNRAITATIANSTVPATFTSGKGENIFTEAGSGLADSATGIRYANVLRGVMMYPSGVVPSLVASRAAISNNVPVGQIGTKPNAKAKINFLGAVTAAHNIIITDGATPRTYVAVNNGNEDGLDFKRGDVGGASVAATDFARAVNAATGHAGKIFAHASGSMVTLSQVVGGSAGDTEIQTTMTAAEATVDSHFEGGANTVIQLAGSTAPFEDNPTISGIENGGSPLGKVDLTNGKQEFVMILNGHKSTTSHPNAVTASFDPQASNYIANIFNTDPTAIQESGHYLYAHYDVFSTYASPMNTTNPYLTSTGKSGNDIAMLLPSSGNRNAGTATKPNTENFSDRFRAAVSPTLISQKFGGNNEPLFRVHSLDDGAQGNEVYKVSIENLKRSQSDKNRYGSFDLMVRRFSDNDREQVVLEKFPSLSLNPNSERYIARIIGDQRLFYDFDKRAGSQKLSLSGRFENNSKYIRVEMADSVENGKMDASALPFGFRGPQKLNIDNSVTFAAVDSTIVDAAGLAHEKIVAPPLPLRRNLAVGEVPKKRVASSLNWGIQFEVDDLYHEPNKNSQPLASANTWTKYFPDFDQASLSLISHRTGSSAADTYNNNKFTLENIQVVTTAADVPDSAQWAAAEYRRTGVLDSSILDADGNTASSKTRFLNTTTDLDLGSVRRYLKFNVFVAGGFDGTEVFDKEKAALSDVAVMREVVDVANQGGKAGATAATYMKAIDVLTERSDVDIQLLAIPGIRQTLITDKAIDAVESRFDAMYIMDAIVYDSENTVVTGSAQKVSVSNTVTRFNNRVLDTSFAATYFPDVILNDPSTGQNIQVPPSVPVLGAFALNDQLAHPWFAPAGFTRGAMVNVTETQVKLNRDNLDSLYDVDINPLTSFPHTEGVVVFGQKTLLRTQSSLDRVNVRRLLIELRRRVRKVANSFIFEPNRESTLARFSAQVNPILRQIQQQQGVDRFLVKIDATTTTQTDVENNTLRGKIFLQPTRSVEFISLDFVITNAGAEI